MMKVAKHNVFWLGNKKFTILTLKLICHAYNVRVIRPYLITNREPLSYGDMVYDKSRDSILTHTGSSTYEHQYKIIVPPHKFKLSILKNILGGEYRDEQQVIVEVNQIKDDYYLKTNENGEIEFTSAPKHKTVRV